MSNKIDINGKELLTIKDVSEVVDYSRDYITRLARERKIVATQIGRKWYVDVDSLKNYQSVSQHEQEVKKRILSDQRKKDLAIKEIKKKKHSASIKRAERKLSVAIVTCAIMFLGLGAGVLLERDARSGFETLSQIANLKSGLPEMETVVVSDDSFSVYAEPVTAKTVEPRFRPTATARSIPAEQNGLLLLSDTMDARVDAQDYFSDPIEIVTATSGDSYIIQTDKNGEQIGTPIPFVIVPVNSNSP